MTTEVVSAESSHFAAIREADGNLMETTASLNRDVIVMVRITQKGVNNLNLELTMFCTAEIDAFYRPYAVEPGVAALLTATYGYRSQTEIRTYSSGEYYSETVVDRLHCILTDTTCLISLIHA